MLDASALGVLVLDASALVGSVLDASALVALVPGESVLAAFHLVRPLGPELVHQYSERRSPIPVK